MGRLVILARLGDRTIRWKCSDIREYRERCARFAAEGFVLEPDPYDRY